VSQEMIQFFCIGQHKKSFSLCISTTNYGKLQISNGFSME
jgi:hypothetical protein